MNVLTWCQHLVVWVTSFFTTSKKVVATVDVLVEKENNQILLIERGHDPHMGKWAMPGGRVDPEDQTLKMAALRELKEETGIVATPEDLEFYRVVGNNTRDARGFCVTTVFRLKCTEETEVHVGDDAVNYQWIDRDQLKPEEMAFDHYEIIN